jgi:GNAT superfamily N-acetyltransferase
MANFRPAKPDDIPALLKLTQTIMEEFSMTRLVQRYRDADSFSSLFSERNWSCVIEEEETLVGYAILVPVPDGNVELSKLYVSKVHRSRGYGRELMKRAIAEAQVRGSAYILIDTAREFQVVPFYEGYGARVVDDWRNPDVENSVLMELALG